MATWNGDRGADRAPATSAERELVLEVAANADCIVQSRLMFKQARTTAFTHTFNVKGDQMRYSETTVLDLYEKRAFDHNDVNTLHRGT